MHHNLKEMIDVESWEMDERWKAVALENKQHKGTRKLFNDFLVVDGEVLWLKGIYPEIASSEVREEIEMWRKRGLPTVIKVEDDAFLLFTCD